MLRHNWFVYKKDTNILITLALKKHMFTDLARTDQL